MGENVRVRIVLTTKRWGLMCEDARWAVLVVGSCVAKSWGNRRDLEQLSSQGSVNLHHLKEKSD